MLELHNVVELDRYDPVVWGCYVCLSVLFIGRKTLGRCRNKTRQKRLPGPGSAHQLIPVAVGNVRIVYMSSIWPEPMGWMVPHVGNGDGKAVSC